MQYRMCVSNLVENKSLADVAPAGGGAEVVNQQKEQQHEGDAGRGVDGVDQKHHDGAANDAQHARMPGEVSKGGPEGRHERGKGASQCWSNITRLNRSCSAISSRVCMGLCLNLAQVT